MLRVLASSGSTHPPPLKLHILFFLAFFAFLLPCTLKKKRRRNIKKGRAWDFWRKMIGPCVHDGAWTMWRLMEEGRENGRRAKKKKNKIEKKKKMEKAKGAIQFRPAA
jgi:hypothetical protein